MATMTEQLTLWLVRFASSNTAWTPVPADAAIVRELDVVPSSSLIAVVKRQLAANGTLVRQGRAYYVAPSG